MRHLLLAYIDPGSGSLILQALAAAVLGAGAYFRHYIARLFRRLTGRQRTDD